MHAAGFSSVCCRDLVPSGTEMRAAGGQRRGRLRDSSDVGCGRSLTLVAGFGRMLVLNRPGGRKAKVASAKVTAPRPFNLPSLKSENSGLDPATQIVPSGGGGWGGGQRSEDDEGTPLGCITLRLQPGSTDRSRQVRSRRKHPCR
jgi:hypothetical protein